MPKVKITVYSGDDKRTCLSINNVRVSSPKVYGILCPLHVYTVDMDDVINAMQPPDYKRIINASWIHNAHDYECSNCHRFTGNVHRYIWCPFCGAKIVNPEV